VRINVFDTPVLPGKPCPHSTAHSLGLGSPARGKSINAAQAGCRIYAERPVDPCIKFQCGWVKPASHLPDWMRPSEAGVIVLPEWVTWRTFPVDLALPVGLRVPPKSLKWLQNYSRESFRPLIYTEQVMNARGEYTGEQKVHGFGPPSFQQEMAELIKGKPLTVQG
jgi:hypothetical protein